MCEGIKRDDRSVELALAFISPSGIQDLRGWARAVDRIQ